MMPVCKKNMIIEKYVGVARGHRNPCFVQPIPFEDSGLKML